PGVILHLNSALSLFSERIFPCVWGPLSNERRQCAFKVKAHNKEKLKAGNVNGSVQVCENSHCCVGYFLVVNGQLEVDTLSCDIFEKSCPDATCKAQHRFNNKLVKCVCNTDLCNLNVTWGVSPQEPRPSSSMGKTRLMVVFSMLVVCLLLMAAVQRRCLSQHKEETAQASLLIAPVSPSQTSQIDITDVQLQQIVARGRFATVWRGTYQGSMVAVKVFPAGAQHVFTSEKEVYGLPLMRHARIIHFLGTGRRSQDNSWLLFLQFAEHGSLHSFLGLNTCSWPLSLKLCLSLAQGLSYLHTNLHTQEGHKPPVAHRDLSSFNVLVRADGTCALCDFGSSIITCSCPGHRQMGKLTGHSQAACTLCYVAPEILDGCVSLFSSCFLHGDVYALGLLLWEICMRCSDLFEDGTVPQHHLPYERELGSHMSQERLIVYVSHMGKRPSIPEHWHQLRQGPLLQDLLTECWDMDPDARLTAHCAVDRLVFLQSNSLV
ncbi:anti-Muellerian hormone type-2 receptor-like, partial [Syngnathus typhle]|uniref:anti-Muellerian hormone type-2 receptor-like n=1 Tax=Syngnathus typhle TaxID=161592 RepID=UPI002A6A5563